MIESTLTWIEKMNKDFHIRPKQVLDIGSLDHNGNPRSLFSYSRYIGIDIKRGKNVDNVMGFHDISTTFQRDQFDAVLCLCFLEHIQNIFEVLDEIKHVLKSGGYLYVSMPGLGFPKHEYPKDYWRVTEETMSEVIMENYHILSLEKAVTKHKKYPMLNCLGVLTNASANQDTA